MAQLVASISGVVLGGIFEIVGSNLARYLQHLLVQLIHYIPLYTCIHIYILQDIFKLGKFACSLSSAFF